MIDIIDKPLDGLVEDPANLRAHSQRNVEAIAGSLSRFGQQKPIVINPDGVVMAGNGTLIAARQLGWESLRCIVSELDGTEATAYSIADNRTSELGEWRLPELTAVLAAMSQDDEAALVATGFSIDEVASLLAQHHDTSFMDEDFGDLEGDPGTPVEGEDISEGVVSVIAFSVGLTPEQHRTLTGALDVARELGCEGASEQVLALADLYIKMNGASDDQ